MALLEVENLKVSFETPSGPFAAVDGVSLCVQPGETLAIVGQSGCGKTVLCRNLMRLCTGGSRAQGSIRLEGRELLGLSEKAMRQIRGKQMAYLFQEPHLALSPSFSIGAQIAEAILVHEKAGKKGARERAMRLIELVRLEPSCYFAYPHQLSGGMLQRAALAVALACQPKLLIADEPTTALDATVQAEILQLLARLKRELGMAMLLITHDFGVAAQLADAIAVMRAGRFVEQGRAEEVLYAPAHPYTWSLLAALPGAEQMPQKMQTEFSTEFWQNAPVGAEPPRLQATPRQSAAPLAGDSYAFWEADAAPSQPSVDRDAEKQAGALPTAAQRPNRRANSPEQAGSPAPLGENDWEQPAGAAPSGYPGTASDMPLPENVPSSSVMPEQAGAPSSSGFPEEKSACCVPEKQSDAPQNAVPPPNGRANPPEQTGFQADAASPAPRFYLSQTHWAAIRRPQPPPVRVRQGKVVIEEGYLAEPDPHI